MSSLSREVPTVLWGVWHMGDAQLVQQELLGEQRVTKYCKVQGRRRPYFHLICGEGTSEEVGKVRNVTFLEIGHALL